MKKSYLALIFFMVTLLGLFTEKVLLRKPRVSTALFEKYSYHVAPTLLPPFSAAINLEKIKPEAKGGIRYSVAPTPIPAPVSSTFVDDSKHTPVLVFSGVMLLASLWVILSKRYPEETLKWSYGTLGALSGYWLGK